MNFFDIIVIYRIYDTSVGVGPGKFHISKEGIKYQLARIMGLALTLDITVGGK